MTEKFVPEAFLPGEFIQDELNARGWKQVDLAHIMGVSTRVVNELIKGKRKITAKRAQELADAFGNPAEEWMAHQSLYDLAKERLVKPDVRKRRSKLWHLAPITKMINRGWLVSTESIDFLEAQVKQFYHRESLDGRTEMLCVARKSSDYGNVSKDQEAWLQRAYNLAATVPVSTKYKKSACDSLRKDMRRLLMDAEEIRHVPRVLSEYGIRFLVVEHLPSTKIDGVCFWLDEHSPVIALSVRYNRIDWFWFTLMHELAHVFYGHGQKESNLDILLVGKDAQLTSDKPEEEKQADLFAEEFLINKQALDNFLARSMGALRDAAIVAFATNLEIHAGIVVGRLQHMSKIPYSRGKKMLVNVRDTVIESALTDGWGYALEM